MLQVQGLFFRLNFFIFLYASSRKGRFYKFNHCFIKGYYTFLEVESGENYRNGAYNSHYELFWVMAPGLVTTVKKKFTYISHPPFLPRLFLHT